MSDMKTKVLLVDDDQMIVDMYKLRLEQEGYEVLVTDKGSEAIRLAGEALPDIVLLDIILPEIDGFSILKSIKGEAATKKIPVLLLTNLSQESDQAKGKELGADGYFVKSQHTPSDMLYEMRKIIKN